MKNTIEWLNSRLDGVEEQISNWEDRVVEFTQTEQQKGNGILERYDNLRDLWNNIEQNNICIKEVPERLKGLKA